MTQNIGILYLIATPIGNLEDMSFRAVRLLKEVDELYCEDTRRTQVLLSHFKVERKNAPKSFHDHSSSNVFLKIKEALMAGKSVGYVTDGGMPVVSDPGFVLARLATQVKATVTVVPGASAAVALFAASALPTPKYLFHGFFPQTKGEVDSVLSQIKSMPVAHIFYEGPSRIVKTLEILEKNLPKTQVVIGRELTKVHEEVLRGTVKEVLEELKPRDKIRGEVVVAFMHETETAKKHTSEVTSDEGEVRVITLGPEQIQEITQYLQKGLSSKDTAKELSKKFGVPRRVIYEYIVKNLT